MTEAGRRCPTAMSSASSTRRARAASGTSKRARAASGTSRPSWQYETRPDSLLWSGGRGQLPPRGSHRSGRAQLRHPAPRMMASLLRRTQFRYLAGLRRDDLLAQCPRHLSPRKSHHPVGRFPSAGSLGAGSPTSPVLSADSDFSPPLAPRFVSFARHYHRFAPLRSPGARRLPEVPDYFYRGVRAASHRWRKRDLPGSWTTLAYMLRSPTPAHHRPQATTGPVMVSSAPVTTSTPQ